MQEHVQAQQASHALPCRLHDSGRCRPAPLPTLFGAAPPESPLLIPSHRDADSPPYAHNLAHMRNTRSPPLGSPARIPSSRGPSCCSSPATPPSTPRRAPGHLPRHSRAHARSPSRARWYAGHGGASGSRTSPTRSRESRTTPPTSYPASSATQSPSCPLPPPRPPRRPPVPSRSPAHRLKPPHRGLPRAPQRVSLLRFHCLLPRGRSR